jgi:hypothetical protein
LAPRIVRPGRRGHRCTVRKGPEVVTALGFCWAVPRRDGAPVEAGTGKSRATLERLAERLDGGTRVKFVGTVSELPAPAVSAGSLLLGNNSGRDLNVYL